LLSRSQHTQSTCLVLDERIHCMQHLVQLPHIQNGSVAEFVHFMQHLHALSVLFVVRSFDSFCIYSTRRYDFPQLLALPNVLIFDQNQA
jgi:hypothetical protein